MVHDGAGVRLTISREVAEQISGVNFYGTTRFTVWFKTDSAQRRIGARFWILKPLFFFFKPLPLKDKLLTARLIAGSVTTSESLVLSVV